MPVFQVSPIPSFKGLLLNTIVSPLLRGGVGAPIKQMPRYLNFGATGEVKQLYDLSGRAASEVTMHFV